MSLPNASEECRPTPFAGFSAPTGSSAGSWSHVSQLAGYLLVRVGAKEALPNFPKKRATNGGTKRSFPRGFFLEKGSGELSPFSLLP